MLAEGIRSGRQSRPSHEKNSDDQSNKSLWDVDDQHVTRGILEEGKLNALLRLLAAHRQLLRQKRSESRNRTWDDFIDETCAATSLTRNELLHKVKRWEVNAGELIFIYVRAISMTSCFVHRPTMKTRWSTWMLSLIHISEPTRLRRISYAVFCLKKKKNKHR